ncbi:hypothetical protein FRC14_004552, partial [Serendipita sp. 396]
LYIPKGSVIHCNIGATLRDSRVWGQDCNEFNPNRFLPEFNPEAGSLPDVSNTHFGFGRRQCPGRFLAERVARQFAASVLSMYTLVPVEGEPVTPTMPFEDSVIRRPIDFKYSPTIVFRKCEVAEDVLWENAEISDGPQTS